MNYLNVFITINNKRIFATFNVNSKYVKIHVIICFVHKYKNVVNKLTLFQTKM